MKWGQVCGEECALEGVFWKDEDKVGEEVWKQE